MVKLFFHPSVSRQSVACFIITAGISIQSTIDRPADASSRVVHTGQVIEQDAVGFAMPAASLETGLRVYDDFTLAELENSLEVCRIRGAPGEEGNSNQVLKKLAPTTYRGKTA